MPGNKTDIFLNLARDFERMCDRAIDNLDSDAEEYANNVATTARELAPRDTGELETNIVYSREAENPSEEIVYIIGVDQRSPADEYAKTISENLEPSPNAKWKKGPRTVLKELAGKHEVGGLYLERAAAMHDLDIDKSLEDAFK